MLSWSWWCTRRSALPETWCSWRKGGRRQVVKFSCQGSPCQGWGRLGEMTRAEVWWGEAIRLVGKDGMMSFAPKESDSFSNILINRLVRRWSISGSLWFRGRAKSSTGEMLSSNRGKTKKRESDDGGHKHVCQRRGQCSYMFIVQPQGDSCWTSLQLRRTCNCANSSWARCQRLRELPSKICKMEQDFKKKHILQELLQLDQAEPSEALAEKEASLLAELASVVQVWQLAAVQLE